MRTGVRASRVCVAPAQTRSHESRKGDHGSSTPQPISSEPPEVECPAWPPSYRSPKSSSEPSSGARLPPPPAHSLSRALPPLASPLPPPPPPPPPPLRSRLARRLVWRLFGALVAGSPARGVLRPLVLPRLVATTADASASAATRAASCASRSASSSSVGTVLR